MVPQSGMAGVGWGQCLKENMTMEQPVQTGGAKTAGKIEKGSGGVYEIY